MGPKEGQKLYLLRVAEFGTKTRSGAGLLLYPAAGLLLTVFPGA